MEKRKIALIGNPNSGKSSLFNQLTGLHQKVGNFPGVTVDRKSGISKLSKKVSAEILDLPGTYSIYPNSEDEKIVFQLLNNTEDQDYPDTVVVVVDASNLERNLLLFTQIRDLNLPMVLALNKVDVLKKSGNKVDRHKLARLIGCPVVLINARKGEGTEELKELLLKDILQIEQDTLGIASLSPKAIRMIKEHFLLTSDYKAYQYLQQGSTVDPQVGIYVGEVLRDLQVNRLKLKTEETFKRYQYIQKLVQETVVQESAEVEKGWTESIDRVLTHRIWGFLIFLSILFLIFQSIFSWSTIPMDWIDVTFAKMASLVAEYLPAGWFADLLTEGIIPGIGGILIFIPQIAFLYLFITVMEESGYMSRVVYLMDRLMRAFGLNGRSFVPLISGIACAVPAIMATRTIGNWKERLATIFVTPLMPCAARLPVYTILIALVIPDERWLGINLQGLSLFGLYMLGFVVALLSSLMINRFIKGTQSSVFALELPIYQLPRLNSILYTIYEKVRIFVWEAGKVIMAISILLWFLASYGVPSYMAQAEQEAKTISIEQSLSDEEYQDVLSSLQLENSFAGMMGKSIEPIIKPLGYDWKIGIALICSFAAREVFVGTMATIYSVGSNPDDEATIRQKLASERDPVTGKPRFDFATGVSLLLFYAFAMMCMSTLAVVFRETKDWKWPVIQTIYMLGLAYVCAFVAYQLLS